MRLNMRRKPPVRLDRTHTVTAKSGPHRTRARTTYKSVVRSLAVRLSRRRPSLSTSSVSPALASPLCRLHGALAVAPRVSHTHHASPQPRRRPAVANRLAACDVPPPFPKSFRTHRRPRPAPSPAKSHHMPPCSRWGRRRAHHHAIVKRGSARLVVPTVRLMKRQVSAVMSRWSRSRSGPTASAASTS